MAYCVECGARTGPGDTTVSSVRQEGHRTERDHTREGRKPLPLSFLWHCQKRLSVLTSTGRGITELVLTFAAIAILTLTITGVAFGSVLMFWRPAAYIVTGTSFFLVLLFSTLNYRNIATWYSLLTILTLIVADSHDLQFTWVAYPFTGLILFYTFSVFMLYRGIPIAVRIITSVTVLLASLALFDLYTHHALTWFFR